MLEAKVFAAEPSAVGEKPQDAHRAARQQALTAKCDEPESCECFLQNHAALVAVFKVVPVFRAVLRLATAEPAGADGLFS
jgi:hypothetical protein